MPGLFITGTNTGVGKTHVAAMIARSLVASGYKVGVYKPVASGCGRVNDSLVAEDAQILWKAAGCPGEFSRVCPQCFAAPLAPPQAAAAEGRSVDQALLRSGLSYWTQTSDIVLVEGAGGLMSPLSDDDYNADLAQDLKFPLVVVAANELGTINATLQTLITARAVAPQLPIAGIVLTQTESREDDPSVMSNPTELAKRSDAPLLATIGYRQQDLPNDLDWFALAR